MSIRVFYTSVSGCTQTKKNQVNIFQYLDSKKIPYEALDISQSTDLRAEMREKSGIDRALPPQIFNGDVYCGDATRFSDAVEMENVEEFLQLKK